MARNILANVAIVNIYGYKNIRFGTSYDLLNHGL